jgi:hypothetical protein
MRSRTAQPGIRRKLPALFEPLSVEQVPSFDRGSNGRSNEVPQDEMTANASTPQETSVSEDRRHLEDPESRTERNPSSETVCLDKHGRLFSRKTHLSLQRPRENVVNARFESASPPEFPESTEIEPIILNTTQTEESSVQEDALRSLLPPSAWLDASERMAQIQQNESAFERHARRFLPPEFNHPATSFSSLRQKSVSNSTPSIEIKIDRIEVQAVMSPAAPQSIPEPPRRKPSLSLDESLEQRKGGN